MNDDETNDDNNWAAPMMRIRDHLRAASDAASVGAFSVAEEKLRSIVQFADFAARLMGNEAQRRAKLEQRGAAE